MAKSRKRWKVVIFSLLGLVLAGVGAIAFFRDREAVITVQTEKVTRRDITEKVVANGKIEPVLEVKISPEVSGEIIDLPVKEGQYLKKGDLLVTIMPDFYIAQVHQCEAGYEAALAGKAQADANLERAEADYRRNKDLWDAKLISQADFIGFKAGYDVAKAQVESARDQVLSAKATVASAQDSLDKTTIVSPMTGTVTKLNSRLGERVLGTVQNVGTEIMRIADLNEMEAQVDLGEGDIVLIAPGQTAQLEVDAFKDRKFNGTVTEIADSSNDSNSLTSTSTSQEATKFQVRIRIRKKERFKPGMSVTAEIATRFRANVLAIPIASVTTRLPKQADKNKEAAKAILKDPPTTNSTSTNSCLSKGVAKVKSDKRLRGPPQPLEVVFVVKDDRVRMVPVKTGISDDDFWEITDGLQEGQEVISGGYRAIRRDLEDGKKVKKGPLAGEQNSDRQS